MILDEEVYVEHFGKKGMHWGVRNAKAAGVGIKRAGLAVGRGTKSTARFVKNHKKAMASIAVGAAAVAVLIAKRGSIKASAINRRDTKKMRTETNRLVEQMFKDGRFKKEWAN